MWAINFHKEPISHETTSVLILIGMKNQGITKVSMSHPRGAMNIHTTFNVNASNIC